MASFPYKDSAVILLHLKYTQGSVYCCQFSTHIHSAQRKKCRQLYAYVKSIVQHTWHLPSEKIYISHNMITNTLHHAIFQICLFGLQQLTVPFILQWYKIHIYVYIYCIKNQHYTKNDSHQNISMNIYNISKDFSSSIRQITSLINKFIYINAFLQILLLFSVVVHNFKTTKFCPQFL